MDVGCAFLDGLQQQGVDQPDHRGVIVLRQQVVDRGGGIGERGQIVVGIRRHLGGFGGGVAVKCAESCLELRRRDLLERKRTAMDALRLDQGLDGRIGAVLTTGHASILHHDDPVRLGKAVGQANRRRHIVHGRTSNSRRAETMPGSGRRSISIALAVTEWDISRSASHVKTVANGVSSSVTRLP